jgi:hypothetical protein
VWAKRDSKFITEKLKKNRDSGFSYAVMNRMKVGWRKGKTFETEEAKVK